jgi:cobalt-zinc-cadmium efflux system outer membrane protein
LRTLALACALVPLAAAAQEKPARITMDEAVALALAHNHALQATRTTIAQSQAQEITAGLRPNPQLSADVSSLPLYAPDQGGYFDSVGIDVGLSWLLERGGKRGRRMEAARQATSVARAQVADSERTLAFNVASQFISVQLAESTLELSQANLASFQDAVDISDSRFRSGGMSENDYLKIKLQLLQFQTDVEQAQLARVQALSDLRQLVGYESVAADYDVAGAFEYRPVVAKLDELQTLAAEHRADRIAAERGVAAARSQHDLAEANGYQDLTLSGTYSRSAGLNSATVGVSIPLAVFDRNQGEIERTQVAVAQAEQQRAEVNGQVRTDVKDAYEGLQRTARVVAYYRAGYLDVSQRSRDISEYAYRRGATSLFDFLDAERAYRATQIGYRQALADFLTAVEQVRQSVGTRTLP